MDPISHMPSPRSLSNHFHCWLNPLRFFILPEYLSNFGGVSRRHLKTEEEFSSNPCPCSRSFVVLASYYPLKLFHLSDIPFLNHPEFVRSSFPVSFTGGHHFSYRYLIIPVLRSSVLQSACNFFVLVHLNPLRHI